MALNDDYKASAIFTNSQADGEVVVTHHYELLNIGTPLTEAQYCAELAQELAVQYVAGYIPILSNQYTLDRVDVYNETQPQYQGTFASGTAGTSAGATVPVRSAVVISKKSGLRGRSLNGRMFLCSPKEDQQDNGVIGSAYKTSLQTFCTTNLQVLLTPNTNQYLHVIYSRKLLSSVPVVSYLVRDTLGSQRGRQSVN